MAIAKFGAIVTDVRGKLGGHVFQGNRFVTSVRTGYSGKGGVQNRASIFQDISKNIRTQWLAEPQNVKNEWGNLANKNPIIGTFGNKEILSPLNMYVRHYTAYYGSNQLGTIDVFNAINDLPQSSLEHVEFNPALQDIDVQFVNDLFSAAVMVYALPVPRSNVKIDGNRLPWIYGVKDETPQDDALWIAFFQKYPNYVMGNPVQFGLVQVNIYGFKSFKKTIYATFV